MSQMIALGRTVYINCANCGKHAWQVSVMLGRQILTCPSCRGETDIRFYTERGCDDARAFKMDVSPRC